ncbi:MAG TPA: PEPxxWA-CTERM sorting domain-containing protein [Sphingomicrobium sp.]|nr:PEPxxWA-CTERM sorting domain-containing protein [Sphingomicrobium sp.]
MESALPNANIARAIRRSRAARASIRRRRRRLVAGACAVVLVGSGAVLSMAGVTGSDAVAAAVSQAKSLAELFDQRSPGDRGAAALTKTKRVHHALAKLRTRPVPPLTPSASELARILLPPAPPVAPETAVALALAEGPPPTLGQIVGPPPSAGPGGGLVAPPGGSGGSPGGGGTGPIVYPGPDTNVIITVPAVPEPGTWATMLLGFGLIGWRIRRGASRRLLPA